MTVNLTLKPLIIHKDSGLIAGITFHESPFPNCKERPDQNDISLLVIHCTEVVAPISAPFDTSIVHYMFTHQYERLLSEYPDEYIRIYPEKTRDVSAHLVIRRSGEVIQYVPFHKLAHHAGVSEFAGREQCNVFSIGIELEGFADQEDFPYTSAQYESLAAVTKAILQTYPLITLDKIVGHDEIARPVGRKIDPGKTFDWERYKRLLGKST